MEIYYPISLGVITTIVLATVVTIAAIYHYNNMAYGFVIPGLGRQGVSTATAITKDGQLPLEDPDAPVAASGDNVHLAWPSNKTGNWEIMFKASTDNGKTFGEKINLSNSTGIDSERPEISASDNNVYVSWWERNATSNEPVMRVSNDNGKTFGERIMLSNK
jgi:hypothetical protein